MATNPSSTLPSAQRPVGELGPNHPPPELGDTERAIYEAARDILAQGGLAAVSMRALASRIGTTPTAIYHYFQSKEELIEQVVIRGFQEFEASLWDAIDDLPAGSIDRLAAIGEAYIRFATEHHQYFKITFGIQAGCPRQLEEVPGQGGYGVLRQCVLEAMEAGTIRRDDPDTVVLYLWSVVHGLVTIFMACECDSTLRESGIEIPEGQHPAGHLFQLFRAYIEKGLLPESGGGRIE